MKYLSDKTFFEVSSHLRSDKIIVFLLYLTLFSFFYNLGIVEFSLSGENPIRIYDITGALLLFYFLAHYDYFHRFVMSIPYAKWFYYFILWSMFTMIFTLTYYSLFKTNWIRFVQTLIYMYHMIIYFIFFIFFIHYLSEEKTYKKFLTFLLVLVIAESIVVILQHLDIIPYLWGMRRMHMYRGFLSGTLGPNRVVLGITMLFSFAVIFPNLINNRYKVNRILLITAAMLSILIIVMSGSRTSYVGLSVYLIYVLLKSPGKLIKAMLFIIPFLMLFAYYQPEIIDTAYESFENRVTNKISDEALEEKDAIQLYDDLGSGRLELALIFIDRLSNNLYALPFGTGFNNRMLFSTSPHNMYLTLIRDVGIVGLFIYLAWLFSYIYIKNPRKDLRIYYVSLRAITWSMVVTLFFGEHLYIFRPLYALWGMFLLVTAFLFVPLFFHPADK